MSQKTKRILIIVKLRNQCLKLKPGFHRHKLMLCPGGIGKGSSISIHHSNPEVHLVLDVIAMATADVTRVSIGRIKLTCLETV